jgi:hypothetical protein
MSTARMEAVATGPPPSDVRPRCGGAERLRGTDDEGCHGCSLPVFDPRLASVPRRTSLGHDVLARHLLLEGVRSAAACGVLPLRPEDHEQPYLGSVRAVPLLLEGQPLVSTLGLLCGGRGSPQEYQQDIGESHAHLPHGYARAARKVSPPIRRRARGCARRPSRRKSGAPCFTARLEEPARRGHNARMEPTLNSRLAMIELPDSDGREVRLGSLWLRQPAVIVFLRHYG